MKFSKGLVVNEANVLHLLAHLWLLIYLGYVLAPVGGESK